MHRRYKNSASCDDAGKVGNVLRIGLGCDDAFDLRLLGDGRFSAEEMVYVRRFQRLDPLGLFDHSRLRCKVACNVTCMIPLISRPGCGEQLTTIGIECNCCVDRILIGSEQTHGHTGKRIDGNDLAVQSVSECLCSRHSDAEASK